MNILNTAEQQANWPKVQAGMMKELKSWHNLGSWRKILRKDAKNIIDSRWVVNWKLINGVKDIKARLVVRGFKDQQGEDLNTSASTASRWGQRIVNQAVVEEGWDLFSFDISAFSARIDIPRYVQVRPHRRRATERSMFGNSKRLSVTNSPTSRHGRF